MYNWNIVNLNYSTFTYSYQQQYIGVSTIYS